MIELSFTFWCVVWGVMACAFICAWIFIVVGCHRMDANEEEVS
jgi:hypothetical protein